MNKVVIQGSKSKFTLYIAYSSTNSLLIIIPFILFKFSRSSNNNNKIFELNYTTEKNTLKTVEIIWSSFIDI